MALTGLAGAAEPTSKRYRSFGSPIPVAAGTGAGGAENAERRHRSGGGLAIGGTPRRLVSVVPTRSACDLAQPIFVDSGYFLLKNSRDILWS